MAGILKNLECHPIKIGGIEDHVHILFALSKNIAFLGIDWVPERLFVKAAERERD
jgi:hypothetical protein